MATGLFEQIKKQNNVFPAEWQKTLTPGTAQYEAAILLNSLNMLPKLVFGKPDKESYSGQYDLENNTITLNPTADSGSLAHEITHALNYKMREQAKNIRTKSQTGPITSSEQQFFKAWPKLNPDLSKVPTYTYPDTDYQQYRFSFQEAPAWAVGNMESKLRSSPGGTHYDATLAQEQAILRDLFARKQLQQQAPVKTPWYKDPFKDTTKD